MVVGSYQTEDNRCLQYAHFIY